MGHSKYKLTHILLNKYVYHILNIDHTALRQHGHIDPTKLHISVTNHQLQHLLYILLSYIYARNKYTLKIVHICHTYDMNI